MALLFADGFEDGTGGWTLFNSMAIGTGRFGNSLVAGGTSSSAIFGLGIMPISTPLVVGCAFKPTGSPVIFALMLSSSSQRHVGLSRGTSGEVVAWRGSSSTVLGSSAINVLPAGAWSYVEARLVCHQTAGVVIVHVNGVQVLNLSGLDTVQSIDTTIDGVQLGGGGSGTTGTAFDDFYLCDTTGSVNNDFLGDLLVEHLRPASDDTAQWVGSDGNSTNNYDLVDEAGTYNGADYVASSTVGQRDLYVPAPSTRPTGSPVHGVIVAAVAMKSDVGTRAVKLDVKEGSGGTVRQSAELGLPTTFGEIRAVFERKGTGGQFTIADVNALRFGIEVST